jgi:hypothetical protein
MGSTRSVAVVHGFDEKIAFNFRMPFTTHTYGMFPDILPNPFSFSEATIIGKPPLQIRLSGGNLEARSKPSYIR